MHDKAGEHAKHLDFIVCDLVSIEIALIAAYLIRIDRAEDAVYFEFYRNINIVILVLYLVIMLFASFHKGILKRGYLKELAAVVTTNVELMLSLLAVLFMLKESQTYSRVLFGMFAVFSVILMYILRTIRKKVLWKRFRDHKENSNVLIVTHRENAKVIYDSLQKDNNGYYDYLGFVDLDGGEGGDILGLPSIALDQVLSYCKENVVNEVYVYARHNENGRLVTLFQNMGITVHVVLNLEMKDLSNVAMDSIGGYTILTTTISRAGIGDLIVKRAFDILVSLIGLVFTGIFFLIFAPIIRAQSKGPAIFAQDRVGKNGKIFKMYKFRSMVVDAEERKKDLMDKNEMKGLMFKMDDDPRITPIGKFIRKTSIDEFPQFWNILKGDMSLVGTRPPTLDEYEKYKQHHMSRLAMKPGLTGMWQTSGRSEITDFEEIVKLDNEYIRNFSLLLDIKLILRTFGAVIGMKGSR